MSDRFARRLGMKILVADDREEIEDVIDTIEQELLDGNLKQDTTYFLKALSELRGLRKLLSGDDDE